MTDLSPFLAGYAERYVASDVDVISAMYEAPLLALREGRVIHLADRTAVRAHLADVMAGYARSGAARADIAALDVVPLGKSKRVRNRAVAGARRKKAPSLGTSALRTSSSGRLNTGGSCRIRTTTTNRLVRNIDGSGARSARLPAETMSGVNSGADRWVDDHFWFSGQPDEMLDDHVHRHRWFD